MYSLEVVITVGLTGAIIGVIAGFIASRKGMPLGAQKEMERHLSELQQQQHNYQQEVNEHFTQTAALLDQLSESYRDVHNHLARGAHKLAGESAAGKITMLPEVEKHELNDDDLRHITPPLDYAPQSSYGRGTLNEEFGIERNPSDDEDDITPPQKQRSP